MTHALEFKPTIMQKLLGRNYKWWYLFIYGIRQNTAYVWADFFWYFGQIVYILAILYLYSNFEETDALKAIILTNLFASFSALIVCYEVDEDISSGAITGKLLFPSNLYSVYFFRRLGVGIRGIIFTILIFTAAMYYYKFDINYLNLIVALICLAPFSLLIKNSADFIIGSLTFWFKNGYGVINLYLTIFAILTGSLIPLNVLPGIILFNPFAFIGYHPMQIYLGKYDTNQTILVFLGGIAWCVVLYFLAKLVFNMGLKRNESVGL